MLTMHATLRTVVLPILLCASALPSRAQGNPPQVLKPMARDADPAFEVATIRPADPDDRNQGFRLDGHRMSIESASVTSLICFAYSIQKSQIVDAPKWFDEQ